VAMSSDVMETENGKQKNRPNLQHIEWMNKYSVLTLNKIFTNSTLRSL